MNTTLLWNNLVAYSLQIGLLIGIAAFVPALIGMRFPKARLAYWHVLLIACLLLPALRPWREQSLTLVKSVAPTTLAPITLPPAPTVTHWSTAKIGFSILAAGAALRLGWLLLGFWRLRRYRLHSRPWHGTVVPFGARPEFRISDDITSPVTFGVLNPVVLLPGQFPEFSPVMQEAIVFHEALHVERRDWVVMLMEELVRTALWFHPAIWWLLGEVQLAREQAVDFEVVQRTQAREEYVDTLLAVAGAHCGPDLAPAPLFLRKRHLKQRVVTIFKEVRMSKFRMFSTLTAGMMMLAATVWFVTEAFPLAAAPQMVADAPGVSVEMNGAQLLHRSPVPYPGEAAGKGIQGVVTVQVKLGADGNVADASILSGPEELRKSVLQSVLGWHFTKENAGSTRTVTVTFASDQAKAAPISGRAMAGIQTGTVARLIPDGSPTLGGVLTASARVPVTATTNPRVAAINITGLSDQARTELSARLPVHVGDNLTSDLMNQLAKVTSEFDEHLAVNTMTSPQGEATLLIRAPQTANYSGSVTYSAAPVQGTAVLTPQTTTGTRRVTIGGNVQAAMLVSGPKPQYPELAKQARIQGTVTLHAFLSADGSVQSLQVIPPAHPLLAPAAVEAVRQWRYKPTLLNGQPVEVETTIEVSFTLNQ